jgi:flavin reductase (DIM6/NTAB) family NADH-FMN oxidoreductase RutF
MQKQTITKTNQKEKPMKKSLGPNTLLYPTPVLLVGTYDPDGKPNLMTAAWGGICCSKPVCVNVSLRKATYSYNGIVAHKAFTLGIPSESQVKEADFMGIATGSKVDKFVEIGWTAERSNCVDAPYAAEIPFVLECKLVQAIELGLHTLFVGEVMDVKAEEQILGENGQPDITRLKPLAFIPGARKYYSMGNFAGNAFSVGKK